MLPPEKLERHPLTVCLRILQGLGKPGEYVWRYSKEIPGLEQRIAYLRDAIAWLRVKAGETIWRELPVDFRTFTESAQLLNKKGVLWPRVIECGSEINSGKYVEAVLTGGIGVAKTTIAIYTQAYQVYVLSCLAAPHVLFDLDPSSEILIVFQSINKNLAQDVDYKRFRDMIVSSPYFNNVYPFDSGRESDMRFPRNLIVKPVAGHDTAAIGQNVIGGIIDEVNFMAVVENSKATRDGTTYDQATQNYNSIARRRESRFMQMGTLPGMLCLVSSRNYPGQFTDKKEAEARTNKRIYVYDKRLWEIRPERFNGEKFRVFIGDETRKPRILEDNELVAEADERLVMGVPTEYRQTFENDLLPALRDVAGVATQALHPFMLNTEAVTGCFGTVQSIASRDDCDFKASKVQLYPARVMNPNEPRFCHIDLALSKDCAGVVDRPRPRLPPHEPRRLCRDAADHPVRHDPRGAGRREGGEIEFENIRKLIYTLRDSMKVPIKWISLRPVPVARFDADHAPAGLHGRLPVDGHRHHGLRRDQAGVLRRPHPGAAACQGQEGNDHARDRHQEEQDRPPAAGLEGRLRFDGRRGGRADHAARDLAAPPGADPAHPEIADREPGPDQGQPELHRAAARAA